MSEDKMISNTKNKKKVIIILIVLLLILIFSIFFIINKLNKNKDIVLYGNVDIKQVSLSFNANGRIGKMYVKEGESVKKDQILAEIDPATLIFDIEKNKAKVEVYRNTVLKLKNGLRPEERNQKQSKLDSTKAELENAKVQLSRLENAYTTSDGQSVSKQELDNAKLALKLATAHFKEANEDYKLAIIGSRSEDIAEAEAELKIVKEELATQQYLLEQTKLKSPIDAIVSSRLQEVGDMASPQHPTYLLTINDNKWVRAYIQEKQLGFIKPGMYVDVYIDSYPNKSIKGKVGYISSVAEFTPKTVQTEELRTSLMYEIRIYVEDKDNLLRMGMPATIKINKQISK
jgi:HlyD family secretion protein